jgi:hypothetical protein
MARIAGVAKGRESWLLRFANRFSRKLTGAELEPTRVMGHNGWVLGGAGAMEMSLGRASTLPLQLKTLVDVKAAMQIGCPF